MCAALLPTGVNTIAVIYNTYHVISYHIIYHIIRFSEWYQSFLIANSVSESRGNTKHTEHEKRLCKPTSMPVGVSSLSFLRLLSFYKQEHVT
jgi:hypothetical protein